MADKMFTAEEAKIFERHFVSFLNKHRLEYRMHRSRTSAYFKIKFDGRDFLIRISDHPSTTTTMETPDFQVLNRRLFSRLKRAFKKVVRLSHNPAYNRAQNA